MQLFELINRIMPKLQKVLALVNDDRLVSIEVDEAFDNAILLTFQEYNGVNYQKDQTYQMRALIGDTRIIYENAVNGADFRDFLDNGTDMTMAQYDDIMNL